MNYAKIYKKGNLNGEKFMDFAKWIVDNHVASLPGAEPLTVVQLANITEVMSMDLATGSQLTKNRYIMTGVVIGGVTVAGLYTINNFRKRRRA